MNEQVKVELCEFISKKVGVYPTSTTDFFDDLGITGLDAILLMDELGLKYSVDMSGYQPDHYHMDEADLVNFPKTIYNFIRGKRYKSFTLDHLIAVIARKKWFDPE